MLLRKNTNAIYKFASIRCVCMWVEAAASDGACSSLIMIQLMPFRRVRATGLSACTTSNQKPSIASRQTQIFRLHISHMSINIRCFHIGIYRSCCNLITFNNRTRRRGMGCDVMWCWSCVRGVIDIAFKLAQTTWSRRHRTRMKILIR